MPPDLANILSYMKDLSEDSCHDFALYKPCFCFLQSMIEHFATWIWVLSLDCSPSYVQINTFYFYYSLILVTLSIPWDTGHALIKYSKLAKLPLSRALVIEHELHYIHHIFSYFHITALCGVTASFTSHVKTLPWKAVPEISNHRLCSFCSSELMFKDCEYWHGTDFSKF